MGNAARTRSRVVSGWDKREKLGEQGRNFMCRNKLVSFLHVRERLVATCENSGTEYFVELDGEDGVRGW